MIQMEDSILDLKEKVILLNNKIKEYEVNIIPTLEHNIDVLVDSEDRLNNIINELETIIKTHYIVGYEIVNNILDDILIKLKELKEENR